MSRARSLSLLPVLLLGTIAPQAAAQTSDAAATDSLRLPTLVTDALRADPRQRQLTLQQHNTSLRLQSIDAERLPGLSANGQAEYASRVVMIPIRLPNASPPLPPHDTYDAHAELTETLFDPTRTPRRSLERAELAENQAGVRVTVYGVRGEMDESFFTAVGDAERAAAMDATIADLEGRLGEARDQLRAGAALPGDTATIAATLLQRRQDVLQLRADERAARSRIAQLVDRDLPPNAPLALPDRALAVAADAARAVLNTGSDPHDRPEFAQFAATRARLSAQEEQTSAELRPHLVAFSHVGIGRPGLDIFSQAFQGYWTAGVQAQWTPWNWGTNRRDREELEVQRDIASTNETAFAQSVRRAVQVDLATIDRLAPTLALDDSIIVLREVALKEASAQLHEGVLTAAAYLDRSTDLLSARLTRTDHRVTLAQARVHLLNTLGIELPTSQ